MEYPGVSIVPPTPIEKHTSDSTSGAADKVGTEPDRAASRRGRLVEVRLDIWNASLGPADPELLSESYSRVAMVCVGEGRGRRFPLFTSGRRRVYPGSATDDRDRF